MRKKHREWSEIAMKTLWKDKIFHCFSQIICKGAHSLKMNFGIEESDPAMDHKLP